MQDFKRRAGRMTGASAAALLSASLLAAAALALTPTQTRESYVAQAEPLCKKNTRAIESILKGVERKIRNDKLKAAAGQFSRAAAAYERTVTNLRGLQQPGEDSAKLTKWLKKLDTGAGLLRKISKALREGKKQRVVAIQSQLVNNANVANSTVLGFGFKHCLVNSSKFT
ncbi:MAG TPA: hypothetical protein VK889_06875 [Solirubrobacterales bacterium]|nr:hypothetical protein [Solirubrobacterales bacterium]